MANPEDMDMSFDDVAEVEDTQQKSKEDYEDKTKNFSDNDELPDVATEKLVMKEAFTEPTEVTIQRVFMNRFGKPSLSIMHDDPELCGSLNINGTVYMQLKSKFGSKPSQWKGQKIKLRAFPFSKVVKGKQLEGYEIKLI